MRRFSATRYALKSFPRPGKPTKKPRLLAGFSRGACKVSVRGDNASEFLAPDADANGQTLLPEWGENKTKFVQIRPNY
jgi:hypothetical protein